MYDVIHDPVTRPPRPGAPPSPRLSVPAPFLAGVARPILVAVGDAAHLRRLGIVPGDHLIVDGDARPEPGELVAALGSVNAPELPRHALGFMAQRRAVLLGTYDQRLLRAPGEGRVPRLAHTVTGVLVGGPLVVTYLDRFWPGAYVGVFRHVLPTGSRAGRPGVALQLEREEGRDHAA